METPETDAPKEVVQPEVPQGTPPKTEEKPPAQPLTEERVKQLLAETETNLSRKFQSDKDKAVAQVQREAAAQFQRQAEELNTIRQALSTYDPNSGEAVTAVLDRASKDAELNRRRATDQEEANRRVVSQMFEAFKTDITTTLKEQGLPTDDIEWGDTSEAPQVKYNRILKSVVKKAKETVADAEKRAKAEAEAAKLQARKDAGVDSVPEGGSPSISGDKEWLEKFASGEIPMTKANLAKAQKLTGG